LPTLFSAQFIVSLSIASRS